MREEGTITHSSGLSVSGRPLSLSINESLLKSLECSIMALGLDYLVSYVYCSYVLTHDFIYLSINLFYVLLLSTAF